MLIREHPALQVHVSEVGAPHLVDPSRLERSARRLYGEAFEALWGELAPVPEANVRVAAGDVLGLEAFPSPGHASHHVCYLAPDGTLYAGDATGVRIAPGRTVLPVSPPPDLDPEAWERTLAEILRRRPARLALHPGPHARRGLAGRFWPEVLDSSARASLRSALWAVRSALGPAASQLETTREQVGLAAEVQTDLEEFRRLLAAGDRAGAVRLRRGRLLSDLDDEWALEARA